jgi:hypothetical protein
MENLPGKFQKGDNNIERLGFSNIKMNSGINDEKERADDHYDANALWRYTTLLISAG